MKIQHLDIDLYARLVKNFSILSKLFSDSEKPYLPYRFVEHLFTEVSKKVCFKSQDISRSDNSFDNYIIIKPGDLKQGVGVKTFVKANTLYKDEKIAEFTKYANTHNLNLLDVYKLIQTISDLRNARVTSDAQEYGINIESSFYHCLVRVDKGFFVHEEPYILVNDIKNLKLLDKNCNEIDPNNIRYSNGVITFSDGINIYKYNQAKNVLLKRFFLNQHSNFLNMEVDFLADPFKLLANMDSFLQNKLYDYSYNKIVPVNNEFIILPLYQEPKSTNYQRKIPTSSGINQWNAAGRKRKFGESYIAVPRELLRKKSNFFPINKDGKCASFDLCLPNGKCVCAKLCQEGNKALMSDPNVDLLDWLYEVIDGSLDKAKLRKDDNDRTKNRPYTYDDLLKINKDSVAIIKISAYEYSIKFMPIGAFTKYKEANYEYESIDKLISDLNE